MIVSLPLAWLACTPDPPSLGPPGAPPTAQPAPTAPTGTPATGGGLRFASGRTPKNLLTISIDTLRADHLQHMPFLQGRAQAGWSVPDTQSCSNWTQVTTADAMGGRSSLDLADETGVFVQTGQRPYPRGDHPEGTPFLADWLGDAGFYSMLVTANGVFGPDVAQGRGFDEAVVSNRDAPWVVQTGQRLLDEASSEGRIASDQPWYLHLHFFEPHRPYTPDDDVLEPLVAHLPPPPVDLSTVGAQDRAVADLVSDPPVYTVEEAALIRAHMRARYVGEVRSLDRDLETIWADIEALGLLDDTLVLFFTDHGEALWDHGDLNDHGRLLHGNETDGAAFFWAHDLIPGVFRGPVASEDLAPTVLQILAQPLPDTITGFPLGTAPDDRARFALADALQGVVQSVRLDGHQLQLKWGAPPPGASNVSWFDRNTDPAERDDRFDPTAPDPIAAALWDRLAPRVLEAQPWIAQDPRDRRVTWPEGLPRPDGATEP